MNRSRLAILSVVAIGIAIVAATQTCRERPPAETTAASDAKAASSSGVAPRATDTPMDLRERERLRQEGTEPAGVAATPEAAPAPTPPVEGEPRREEPTEPAEAPPLPPASPTIEASMAAAKAAAQDEVAKIHGEMKKKCWDDFDRGGVGDGGIKVSFSLGYDAEGRVLASAVQQTDRASYIQGLETCLAPFAHGLTVPSIGEPVSVEVEVELP